MSDPRFSVLLPTKRCPRPCAVGVLNRTSPVASILPVALAKFRLWEPLTRQAASSGVRPVSAWLNRLLYLPLAAESAWCGIGGNFPIGQSIVLIGEKA